MFQQFQKKKHCLELFFFHQEVSSKEKKKLFSRSFMKQHGSGICVVFLKATKKVGEKTFAEYMGSFLIFFFVQKNNVGCKPQHTM